MTDSSGLGFQHTVMRKLEELHVDVRVMSQEIKELAKDLGEHDRILNGNGQTGIRQDVAVLKAKYKSDPPVRKVSMMPQTREERLRAALYTILAAVMSAVAAWLGMR